MPDAGTASWDQQHNTRCWCQPNEVTLAHQGHPGRGSKPAIIQAEPGNIGNSSFEKAGKSNPRVSVNVLSVLNNLGVKQIEFGLCHHNKLQENLLKINDDLRQ